MNIKEFSEIIKERLEERTGLEVRLAEVKKNNSVIFHGINIIVPETNILPTIYLESYLKDYENGISLEDTTEAIVRKWEREREHTPVDMEWFKDFSQVRGKVAYRIVNFEANREMLQEIPYIPFLNLAKVFYVALSSEEYGDGSILIQNRHMKFWGVSTEELDEIASQNTPKLFQAEVIDLEDVVKEIMQSESTEFEISEEDRMYVVTNRARHYGAAVMCYPSIIKEFAEQKECDLLIIPSSIHEVIILPYKKNQVYIKNMVKEVNATQVAPEEVLSDSVYVYQRETDSITIA